MSTRSRASFLLEALCFILLASSASWLGGTQRGGCAVCIGFPANHVASCIHCPLLVRTLNHIPFKLVSQSQTHACNSFFCLLAFLATNHLTYGSCPRYGKYLGMSLYSQIWTHYSFENFPKIHRLFFKIG